ncbi:MAG: hypothetical protein WC821_03515 [archaeon]|jgi:hypothetical protein
MIENLIESIFYPFLLIIIGFFVASLFLIFFNHVSIKLIKLFQLYPESKGILVTSFRFISWFISAAIFLLFLRLALKIWGLDFTLSIIEAVIVASPKYIIAILVILCGFYVSRIIHEKSKDYDFEYRNRILVVIDFIIHMTFVFTALYVIGVNITFFLEFYKAVLLVVGAILVLVISMTIGIPLGINVYERMKVEKKTKLKKRK